MGGRGSSKRKRSRVGVSTLGEKDTLEFGQNRLFVKEEKLGRRRGPKKEWPQVERRVVKEVVFSDRIQRGNKGWKGV